MSRCRQKDKDATYLFVLSKGFDLGAGLAFGEASPGDFGAVACPAWLDAVDPFIFGPFALALGACAFDTCYMHAVFTSSACCAGIVSLPLSAMLISTGEHLLHFEHWVELLGFVGQQPACNGCSF